MIKNEWWLINKLNFNPRWFKINYQNIASNKIQRKTVCSKKKKLEKDPGEK